MTLNLRQLLLALGTGPTAPGTEPDPRGQLIQMVGMIVLMGVIFYFGVIRPQRVRTKQQQAILQTLKPGDKILTSSGIIGVVVSIKDKTVSIRSADAKLEILKSAVTEVTERSAESKS
ncbi:MAG: preprotein translocase subunit YajC [Verrucomicrobia bacterium]|nr:preprotein translocase subunit YajC [Verrucomicrobiota bacterium]